MTVFDQENFLFLYRILNTGINCTGLGGILKSELAVPLDLFPRPVNPYVFFDLRPLQNHPGLPDFLPRGFIDGRFESASSEQNSGQFRMQIIKKR